MDKMGREELVEMYRPDVERLVYFLPWLEGKTGKDVTTSYEADEHHATLAFPVYDEILLGFLNELSATIFMDQNYQYLYTRNRIRDYRDELALIEKADIMSMDILKGIFSRYVLGGMTKAYLWTQGIEYKIFETAVKRAKDIIEFWSVPIEVRTIDMDIAEQEAMLAAEREAAEREAAEAAEREAAEAAEREAAQAAEREATQAAEREAAQAAEREAEDAPAEPEMIADAAEVPTEAAEQPAEAEVPTEAAEQPAEAEVPTEAAAEPEETKPAEEPKVATEVEVVRAAEDVLVREEKPAGKTPAKKRTSAGKRKTKTVKAENESGTDAAQKETEKTEADPEAPAEPKKPRKPRKKRAKKEEEPIEGAIEEK